MSITLPQDTDYLNAPDHSKFHRIIAADILASDESLVVDSNGKIGLGVTPSFKLSIGSTDNSQQVGILHDNTNAYFQVSSGCFYFKTDQGTNTDTKIYVTGKGTGVGEIKIFDGDNLESLNLRAESGRAIIDVVGTSPVALSLQKEGNYPVDLFYSSNENITQELKIYGFCSGDSLRSLEIGVGVDAADTASFDGLSTYLFDGDIKVIGNNIIDSGGTWITSDGSQNTTLAGTLSALATNLGDGGTTDYTEIKSWGEINLHNRARVIRHLLIDPKRFKLPAADYPGESFEGLYYTLDFDKSTEESAYCQEYIPYRWASGTDVEVAVDWMFDGADVGAVVWGMEYKSIGTGETVAGAGTTITQTTAGSHTAEVMIRTTFSSKILGFALAWDDIMAFRFFRKTADGSDTLDRDAKLMNVHFHFKMDKLGKTTSDSSSSSSSCSSSSSFSSCSSCSSSFSSCSSSSNSSSSSSSSFSSCSSSSTSSSSSS